MPHATKITTCCYCGARAALVLRGQTRHDLSCASCGAPIHVMKRLQAPSPAPGTQAGEPQPRRKTGRSAPPKRTAVSHRAAPKSFDPPRQPKKRKRRKTMLRWVFEEVGDVLEDAKDAIEDIFD